MTIFNSDYPQSNSVEYSDREPKNFDLSLSAERSYVTNGKIFKFIDRGNTNNIGPGSYETDPLLIRKRSNSILWKPPTLKMNQRPNYIGPGSYDVNHSDRMVHKRSSNPTFARVSRYS
jgi:hypothetical protein